MLFLSRSSRANTEYNPKLTHPASYFLRFEEGTYHVAAELNYYPLHDNSEIYIIENRYEIGKGWEHINALISPPWTKPDITIEREIGGLRLKIEDFNPKETYSKMLERLENYL